MAHDSTKRKGATWKRFVAGVAIAAATTVAGAGMADAAAPRALPNPPTTPAPGQIGTTGSSGGTIHIASAASGIRW